MLNVRFRVITPVGEFYSKVFDDRFEELDEAFGYVKNIEAIRFIAGSNHPDSQQTWVSIPKEVYQNSVTFVEIVK